MEQVKETIDSIFKIEEGRLSGFSFSEVNYGMMIQTEKGTVNAQWSHDEMGRLAYWVSRRQNLDFLPGFKEVKECEEVKEENKRLDQINNGLSNHNEDLRKLMKNVGANLFTIKHLGERIRDAFLEGDVVRVDDMNQLEKMVRLIDTHLDAVNKELD